MEFKTIAINWQPPKQIAHDTYIEWKTINFDQLKIPQDCLYQAYGNSIIYGENKLLYIGQTIDGTRRLRAHLKNKFNRILNLSLTVGEFDNKNQVENQLELIENILICYVKPSYNSASLNDIHIASKKTRILILNKGNRGSLPLECSNYWWPFSDKQN